MSAAPPELEVLFIDMDAYFASVEQMDHPDLRGRPIGVTPIVAPSGCCIATSYEARALGVKTGCQVREARRLCPDIAIIKARPDRYITVHHELLAAVERVLPVTEVESVDECWCRLLRNERSDERALALAMEIKASIADNVGSVTCSIGLAPNRLLAKVAGAMTKPNGLTLLPRRSLPESLHGLSLTDLPGINTGINRRLRAAGIHSVADLCDRSAPQLRAAWGSVLGVYWHHWLRGDQLPTPKTHRRTVGHQHVLAPQYRAREQARGVSLRLLSKAAQRMRSLGYVCTRLSLHIRPLGDGLRGWGDWAPLVPTDDTVQLNIALGQLWHDAPEGDILQVGVRLEGLEPADTQIPLFPDERARRDLMRVVDRINREVGADSIYIASMHDQRKTAPRRIPFGQPPSLDLPDEDGSEW